ncbi:zinc-binding dehydrogenase [Virgibacillus halophilus]|uniref:Zinc-binding dehydrogenase n=1 Tax=Tigheibacillus halophilus TaxID=361280 RepID=A0ABU5CAE4_9BACI|nr:zinc-binding dehydrogenase [Virgibacillus halophilus]
MKAFVFEHGHYKMKEMTNPTAGHGEVIVSLKCAGLNHRDLFIGKRLGNDKDALILGSDGAGVITAVGDDVKNVSVGDEVIINPSLGWPDNSVVPPAGFDILGMPDNGTFAEKIVIAASQVEKKPAYLTWQEAGVLALSGMTGYRAMFTKGELKKGQTVFIPGAGSGVATYLISFAASIGAKVIVTSRSEQKQQLAKQLGAHIVLDSDSDWSEALKNETIDLVIDSVGQATFNKSFALLKPGGRFVVFGSSTDDTVELNLRQFFYAQQRLIGSTMASREELLDMLSFMDKHQIHPVVDTDFELTDAKKAMEHLEGGKQFGKVALCIS